jgi:hypothetical protein
VASRRHPSVLAGPSGLAVAEGCWGAALLFGASPLLRLLAGTSVHARVVTIARVLGARQLLQALITVWRPTRQNLERGAAVDAVHAATMFAAAAANIAPRRLTIASATTASTFAAVGLAQSRLLGARSGARSAGPSG